MTPHQRPQSPPSPLLSPRSSPEDGLQRAAVGPNSAHGIAYGETRVATIRTVGGIWGGLAKAGGRRGLSSRGF